MAWCCEDVLVRPRIMRRARWGELQGCAPYVMSQLPVLVQQSQAQSFHFGAALKNKRAKAPGCKVLLHIQVADIHSAMVANAVLRAKAPTVVVCGNVVAIYAHAALVL